MIHFLLLLPLASLLVAAEVHDRGSRRKGRKMATHTRSWKRNGNPRKMGRFTMYEGTTQAKAVCSCGWEGSWFPTRNIEFYEVVGEREFASHVESLTTCDADGRAL